MVAPVLRLASRSVLARLAVALLALTLSGAAQAVPARPLGAHRCSCRSHGERHVCACPVCNGAARKARAAARRAAAEAREPGAATAHADALPPCHRGRLSAPAPAPDDHDHPAPPGGALQPTCGDPPGAFTFPAARDPWPPPPAPGAALRGLASTPPARAARATALPALPELPPPRLARR